MTILEAQTPTTLIKHIFNYFDECAEYTHFYIFEVCNSPLDKYTVPYDWTSNGSVPVCTFVQDWRGRCYRKSGFGDLQQYCETGFIVLRLILCNAQRFLSVTEQ